MNALGSFAQAARSYIEWAERAEPASAAVDAREVLGLLLDLCAKALNLPEGEGADDERPGTSHEQWAQIYSRCANLPVDRYWEVFNPLTAEPEEPVGTSLGDDLADVHRDLKLGMSYYDEGNEPAAAWQWQFNFRAHWGHHASAAIYALYAWWSEEYFAEPSV